MASWWRDEDKAKSDFHLFTSQELFIFRVNGRDSVLPAVCRCLPLYWVQVQIDLYRSRAPSPDLGPRHKKTDLSEKEKQC